MMTKTYTYDSKGNKVEIKEENKSFMDWVKEGFNRQQDNVTKRADRKRVLNALADALLAEATVIKAEPVKKESKLEQAVREATTSA